MIDDNDRIQLYRSQVVASQYKRETDLKGTRALKEDFESKFQILHGRIKKNFREETKSINEARSYESFR